MKNKLFLSLSLIGLFSSCSDEITDLNKDVKNPTTVNATYLFTNAEKAMVDQISSTSVNENIFRLFAQQWTECSYPQESQYDITGRKLPDTQWAVYYRDVLRDLKESKEYLQKETYTGTPAAIATANEKRTNKLALIEVLSAYSYSILVDTFGDVPYTEALDILGHPQPKYDDALTIYKDLISRLTTASATLKAGTKGSFGSADLIYSGDTQKWAKFANSLRLRMAINLFDIDQAYATPQILAAVSEGVISSNDDNTNLAYTPLQPNTNPLYLDFVASGRFDFVAADTFVNALTNLSDPRIGKYFEKNVDDEYVGGEYGAINDYDSFSPTSTSFRNPEYPGTIFDLSEVEFLLAEAAARGVAVGGTPASHYNAAITASMESWNVDPALIAPYLAQSTVDYSNILSGATWQEKIGNQSWIALHNRGLEAWSSYRRLDFPNLKVPAETYGNITEVPKRFSYPVREQTLNSTEVQKAITKLGDNKLTTRIFWDKN